jgi:alcohol dehydrogenase (cytochrome c)
VSKFSASSDRKPITNDSNVTASRIIDADREPENWLTHGRTYSEQRFSPLKQINDTNANRLGLAWYYDLDTNRGQEASPLWSMVLSISRRHGAR